MNNVEYIKVSHRIDKMNERGMVVPSIKADRDILVKKAYIENEAEPVLIKRANTLRKVLEEMPINIGEDELNVGNIIGGIPRAVGLYLELSKEWKEKELDRFAVREADRFIIDEAEKDIFRSLFPFWEGKSVEDRIMAIMPEETKKIVLDLNSVIDVNIHMKATGLGHVALYALNKPHPYGGWG
jgi:choline trimethylamine-lyase